MLLLLTQPGPILGCKNRVKSNAALALKRDKVKSGRQPGAMPTRESSLVQLNIHALWTTIGSPSIRFCKKHIGREQLATRQWQVFFCYGVFIVVIATVYTAFQDLFSVALQGTAQRSGTETHSRQL